MSSTTKQGKEEQDSAYLELLQVLGRINPASEFSKRKFTKKIDAEIIFGAWLKNTMQLVWRQFQQWVISKEKAINEEMEENQFLKEVERIRRIWVQINETAANITHQLIKQKLEQEQFRKLLESLFANILSLIKNTIQLLGQEIKLLDLIIQKLETTYDLFKEQIIDEIKNDVNTMFIVNYENDERESIIRQHMNEKLAPVFEEFRNNEISNIGFCQKIKDVIDEGNKIFPKAGSADHNIESDPFKDRFVIFDRHSELFAGKNECELDLIRKKLVRKNLKEKIDNLAAAKEDIENAIQSPNISIEQLMSKLDDIPALIDQIEAPSLDQSATVENNIDAMRNIEVRSTKGQSKSDQPDDISNEESKPTPTSDISKMDDAQALVDSVKVSSLEQAAAMQNDIDAISNLEARRAKRRARASQPSDNSNSNSNSNSSSEEPKPMPTYDMPKGDDTQVLIDSVKTPSLEQAAAIQSDIDAISNLEARRAKRRARVAQPSDNSNEGSHVTPSNNNQSQELNKENQNNELVESDIRRKRF